MKITDKILQLRSAKKITFKDTFPAYFASIFSILFSLSIVLELSKLVDPYVLIFLGIFITLFLIFNERLKVKELKQVVKGNNKAIPTLLFSFIISMSLSCIGIYFWTNKSQEIKDDSAIDKTKEISEVKVRYENEISSIMATPFIGSDIEEQISFWKSRRAATIEERAEIRDRVEKYQSALIDAKIAFNSNLDIRAGKLRELMNSELEVIEKKYEKIDSQRERNNLVSYIFFAMVFITEFIIISLNKNIAGKEMSIEKIAIGKGAKNYIHTLSMLNELYLIRKQNQLIDINTLKYTISAKKLSEDQDDRWKKIKQIYNLFILLDIISEVKDSKNQIKSSKGDAVQKLNAHFEQVFNLN